MLDKLNLTRQNAVVAIAVAVVYILFRLFVPSEFGLNLIAFLTALVLESYIFLHPIQKLFDWTSQRVRIIGFVILLLCFLGLGFVFWTGIFPSNIITPFTPTINLFVSIVLVTISFALLDSDEKTRHSVTDWLRKVFQNEFAAPGTFWMVLLWGCVFLAAGNVFALITSVVTSAPVGLENPSVSETTLVPSFTLPVTILLAAFHWRSREAKLHSIAHQISILIYAIILAALTYFATAYLWQLPRLWDAELPVSIDKWAIPAWRLIILAFTLTIVVKQRNTVPIGIRLLITGTVGGGLAAILLSYPAYIILYDRFVPGVKVFSPVDQAAGQIQIVFASIPLLLAGPISAWWLRPANRRRQAVAGAVTGAVAGTILWGLLVGPVAAIAAQNDLYGAAFSRTGYGGYDWIVKLAFAINQSFAGVFFSNWIAWGSGIVIGGFTAFFVRPSPQEEEPSSSLVEAILAESVTVGGMLLLILSLIVTTAILTLLPDQVQIILDRAGVSSAFSSDFGLNIFLAQHLLLLILQMAVFLVWLYRRVIPLVSQLPVTNETNVLLAQTNVTGWAIALLAFSLPLVLFWISSRLLAETVPLTLILGMVALGLEIIFAITILRSSFKSAKKPVSNLPNPHTNWLGMGFVWGAFIGAVIYQFLIWALAVVLIAVSMIGDLTVPANVPMGPAELEQIITNAFGAMTAAFPPMFLGYIFMNLTGKDPMIGVIEYLRKIATGEETLDPADLRRGWMARIPILQRPYAWLDTQLNILLNNILLTTGNMIALLSILAVIILLTTTNPLLPLVFLAAAMLIWPPDRFPRRLPWPLFTIAFLVTLAGIIMAGLPAQPDMVPSWITPAPPTLFMRLLGLTSPTSTWANLATLWTSPLVRLFFGLAAAVSLRAFHLYHLLPGISRSLRPALFFTGVFLIIAYTVDPQGVLNLQGSVAQYDGQSWQSAPALIGGVGYDFFQDSQGRLWYTTGTGIIMGQSGEEWQRYSLFTVDIINSPIDLRDTVTVEERRTILEGRMLLVEDQAGQIWTAQDNQFGRFNPTYYHTEGTVNLETISRIDANGRERGLFLGHHITGMDVDGAGFLWIATNGDGLVRVDTTRPLDDSEWEVFTTENSDLISDNIYAIVSASNQIWLSTEAGIIQFDGKQWQSRFNGTPTSPVTLLWTDDQGGIWAANQSQVTVWRGESWSQIIPIGAEDVTINTYFTDSRGGVFVGTDSRVYRIDDAGIQWAFSDGAQTFAEYDDSVIWGGDNTGVESIGYDLRTNEFLPPDVTKAAPAGAVRDMIAGADGSLWVSMFNITQETQSTTWSLVAASIMLVGLYGSTLYGYQRAPETRANRLNRRLRRQPETFYPAIYELLAKETDAPTVLSELAQQLSVTDRYSAASIQRLISPLADQNDGNNEGMMAEDELNLPAERAWANEVHQLFQALTAVTTATHIPDIVNLELVVNPGPQADSFYLSWCNGRSPILPPFLPAGTRAAWQALEHTSTILRKYEDVDTAGDRLSYLAQALTAAEAAQAAAAQVGLPEGPIMQTVAENWRTAVTNEINHISGRAELRLELRTRQVRRAERVTIALRLRNVGRAAAESVIVSLADGELGLVQPERIEISRLPSGRENLIEFTIAPPETDTTRIACHLAWDDLTQTRQTLAFGDVVRFYEMAQEFEPIPNRYIVGHPVKSGEMFHGREDIFRFISRNLTETSDHTLVLHGQRRTGKTSILYQLLNDRLGPAFLPILIDMQELAPIINSTADFLGELAYQLARTVQKAGIAISEPEAEAWEKSAVRAFNRFLDRLEDSLGSRRLVIMFDEFELIEAKIDAGKLDADLLGYFRSLMQHRQGLVFIFTGTHRLEEMSHDYWSILFNIALYRRVSFLERADAVRLIREPVADKLDIDELAVEKIINLTQGHAYFTQLICWALVNQCNSQKQNYATINDVNDAVAEIMRTGEAHFAYIWQQANNEERLAMAALAHALQAGNFWARPSAVLAVLKQAGDQITTRAALVEILDRLALQEVLQTAREGALRYRFQLEILQLWIASTQSVAALVERQHGR